MKINRKGAAVKKLNLFVLGACLSLCCQAVTGYAQEITNNGATVAAGGEQSPAFDADILAGAEKSLNAIQSVDADFIQTSSNNEQLFFGHLKLLRPNKMLLTYEDPEMPRIIADGYSVIYVEDSLEQVTYLGLDDTPAFFLIQDTTSFSDPRIKVLDVEKNDLQVRITVAMAEDSLAGKMTLVFSAKDFQLVGWEITDAKRVKTVISLQNVRMNVPIEKKTFEFINPYTSKKKQYPFLRNN